jgi:hypothetical protein
MANEPDLGAGGTPPALTQADLHAAAEKARLEEREKLRSQITDLETAKKSLETNVGSLSDQVTKMTADLTKATDSLAALQKAKTADGNIDAKALIDEAVSMTEKRILEREMQERQQLAEQVKTLQGNLTAFQLEKLKTELVEKLDGKVVLSLIRGNTAEEMQKSVEEANKAYLAIEERTKQSLNPGATPNVPANRSGYGAPPVVNPGGQGGAGGGAEGDALQKVRQMSPSEFRQNRQKVLTDLKRLYPRRPE